MIPVLADLAVLTARLLDFLITNLTVAPLLTAITTVAAAELAVTTVAATLPALVVTAGTVAVIAIVVALMALVTILPVVAVIALVAVLWLVAAEAWLGFVDAHHARQITDSHFVVAVIAQIVTVAELSRTRLTADRRRITAALLNLLLAEGHDDAVVVFGVLQIALCQHRITGGLRIARE